MTLDPSWHRLHPLTPLLRAAKVFGLAGVLLGPRYADDLGSTATLLVLFGLLVAGAVYGVVSWRVTRYALTGGDLRLETGLLIRRSRRVPLARLQAVDVVRPIVARIFGLAELRLEVVGQGSTEAPLAYLSEDGAQSLRTQLLALARAEPGSATDESEPAPEQQELVLVRVPTGVLVASLALGAPVVGLALLLLAAVVLVAIDPPLVALLAGATAPVALGLGAVTVRRLLGDYGFTVADAGDGLRLRHGLLETRAQTIPPGRVQGVRLVEPLLWRRQNWVRVEVDVAGYAGSGGSDDATRTSALLPVAPVPLARAVLARVLDGVDLDGALWQPAPRRARRRAPLGYRRLALARDERFSLITSGVLKRQTDIVPHAKVQSVRRTQGPWQRRLHLSSLHLDTAGRQLHAVARHRDADEVERLVVEGAALARRARAAEVVAPPAPAAPPLPAAGGF